MKKNVASQTVSAVVVSATDGSAVTASVAITVNGDHGTQGAGGGTLTHEGGGEWSYIPTQAETNFDHILFKFSATGAVPVGVQVYTSFPQTGDPFALIGTAGAGLTALGDTRIANLDAAVSSRSTYAGGAVASVTGNVGGNVTGSIGSLAAQAKLDVNAEADTALSDYGALKPTTAGRTLDVSATGEAGLDFDNVKQATGATTLTNITVPVVSLVNALAADSIDSTALNANAATEIADALLDRNMATGTDSGSPSVRTPRQALRALRNKASIAAGTLTVTKEDDSTASWTAAVTTTAGNPISVIDPA